MERLEQRERLIELIGSKLCENYSLNCDEWQPHSCEKCYANSCRIGDLADYLLSNDDVIVLPCKVGDTVYVISRGDVVPLEVDSIIKDRKGIKILGRNETYWGNGTITLYSDKRYMDWYITKEEAEKELERMKGGAE